MGPASNRLIEAALDLAWSHWTGIGVRGTARPPDTAVDPEALVYFTASLADIDPRLRDEAFDWWHRFQNFASRARLTSLAKIFDPQVVSKFKAMGAFMKGRTTSGKSRLDRLDHPCRALLRLRYIFGANARAEILLALLTQASIRSEGVTASSLAEIGYSKRNVALVLEELRLANIIDATSDANRLLYRLANARALRQVVGPLPVSAGRWHVRLPIISSFVEFMASIRDKDRVIQAIEARKLFARHAARLESLGLKGPRSTTSSADTYWEELQEWLVENLIAQRHESRRRLPGMLEGVWIRPNDEVHRPQSFSSAVLPERRSVPAQDQELVCLDLVQLPTVDPPNDWTWAVLSVAGRYSYEHTTGMMRGEPWRFATWDTGQLRTYDATLGSPLEPQRLADRYGEEITGRARSDHPAVQIRLTRA